MMPFSAPLRRLSTWFWQQSPIKRDLIVMGAIGLPIYCLAVWYDAFDRFLALTHEPESDAIDWLIILFVFLGVAAKIYSVRRTIDLHREVRHRRKAEADAYLLARQDVLTGLPNRRWSAEEFDKWRSEHNGVEVCALFFVDLDNFKPINDLYGHRLGDEVLRVVAKRLTRLAEGGAVARLGGDEFGIVMHYHVDPGVTGNRTMAYRDGAPVHTALRQGEVRWQRPLLLLRPNHGRDGRARSRDRGRRRGRSDCSLLSAARRPHDIKAGRIRGSRTLAAPGKGRACARGFHLHRRGHGLYRRDDRVALDDFGTGYSGLYQLRELDLDIIKIDRSFVTKMFDKPEEARIVKAIVSMSRALGLHTTAEGIETTQVLDRLVKLGCDTGKGDLFDVPVPAATTATAINEHSGTNRRRA